MYKLWFVYQENISLITLWSQLTRIEKDIYNIESNSLAMFTIVENKVITGDNKKNNEYKIITGAQIKYAKFKKCKFKYIKFIKCDFYGSTFSNCNFIDIVFEECNFILLK